MYLAPIPRADSWAATSSQVERCHTHSCVSLLFRRGRDGEKETDLLAVDDPCDSVSAPGEKVGAGSSAIVHCFQPGDGVLHEIDAVVHVADFVVEVVAGGFGEEEGGAGVVYEAEDVEDIGADARGGGGGESGDGDFGKGLAEPG